MGKKSNIFHRDLYVVFDEHGHKQNVVEIGENLPMTFVQKVTEVKEKEIFVNNVLFDIQSKKDVLLFFVNGNYIIEKSGITQDDISNGDVKTIENIDLSEYGFDIKEKEN